MQPESILSCNTYKFLLQESKQNEKTDGEMVNQKLVRIIRKVELKTYKT